MFCMCNHVVTKLWLYWQRHIHTYVQLPVVGDMCLLPSNLCLCILCTLQRKDSKSTENTHDESATSTEASVSQHLTSHGMRSIASDGMEAANLQNSNFTSSNGANDSSCDQQHCSMEHMSLKNSNNYLVQKDAAASPNHMPLVTLSIEFVSTAKHTTGLLKAQQSTEESSSYSAELSSSQKIEEAKQQHQGICSKDTHEEELNKHHNDVTKDRDAFQQYLVKKHLNHLTKGSKEQTITKQLHFCLFMHTDLDVLDDKNKFICNQCTAKKRRKHRNLCVYAFNIH